VASSQGVLVVRQGDLILYSPGESQDYSTLLEVGNWHLLWAHFTPQPHWLERINWPMEENGFKLLRLKETEVEQGLQTAMQRMVMLSKRPLPIALDLAMLALEEALLWASLTAFNNKWVTMDGRVRQAINYMTAHFREPFQLHALARYCGLSLYRLAHLFKEETGLSPQRFMERHRMHVASRLLSTTGFTISEVAAEVGYDDPFYFSNRFRRYSGKSPSHFRATKFK
jgi:AraC family transcriptional regulator of arabinose operon